VSTHQGAAPSRGAAALGTLSEALVRAVSLSDVAFAAATYGPAAAGAQWGHAMLFDHGGGAPSSVVGGHGAPSHRVDKPVLDRPPWDQVLAGPATVEFESGRDLLRRDPTAEPMLSQAAGTVIVAPLLCGGRCLGMLLLAFRRPGVLSAAARRRVDPVVALCASAAERAGLYDTGNLLAQRLQRAVLPVTVPPAQGLRMATRYLPSERELKAGGDWYDVIPLPHGGSALVVGDVSGHGIEAASLMSALRAALRAYFLLGSSPAEVLERLSDFVDHFSPEQMATVFVVVFDPAEEHVRFANAGHPAALVLSGDSVQPLVGAGGPGPPAGSQRGVSYSDHEATFPVGAALVLYSDGLVERRTEPLDVGLERLVAAAAKVAQDDPEELSDALVAEMLAGVQLADDVATLVAIRQPAGRSGPLAPAPFRVRTAPTRRDLTSEIPGTAAWHPNPEGDKPGPHQRFTVMPEQSGLVFEVRSTMGVITFGTLGLEGFIDATIGAGGTPETSVAPNAHLEVMLNRLTSGNALYDAELLRHIDARRYPTAFLELHTTVAHAPPSEFRVTGELCLRGVNRPMSGIVTVTCPEPSRLVVDGQQELDIGEFGIPQPTLFMIKIEPQVLVRLHVEALATDEL
jgi:GAF domain-containing protein/polyisoprenoid-binding protein YceI